MTLLSTSAGAEVLAAAEAAALGARARSGVEILEVLDTGDTERAAELLREVWRGPVAPVPANLVRTVQHIGGYVYGAYDDAGTLLAVSLGMLAAGAKGEPSLHSHITGVAPLGQRRGLGYALKQHQRVWALEHGMSTITWTCDPLIRRNVLFNLHALGAQITGYLTDHYGRMDDGVNTGDETDRFELVWNLGGELAMAGGQGRIPFLPRDLPVAVAAGEAGLPVVYGVPGSARLVQLPSDIEALRRSDPSAGRAWRVAVRHAIVPALAEGAAISGLTSSGQLVLEIPS